tara:strand:- start:314 stop:433 length:120 start_codon:yes stop_codon:yes gene_type:complete
LVAVAVAVALIKVTGVAAAAVLEHIRLILYHSLDHLLLQ